jgi:hypothetical protein
MDSETTKVFYECINSLDTLIGKVNNPCNYTKSSIDTFNLVVTPNCNTIDNFEKCISQFTIKGISFHQMFPEHEIIRKSETEMTSLARHIARYCVIPEHLFEYLISNKILLNNDEQFFTYLMEPDAFMCLNKFEWVCQKIITFFDSKMVTKWHNGVENVFQSLLFVHSMINEDSLVELIEYFHKLNFNFKYTPDFQIEEIDFDLDTMTLCERMKLKKCVNKFNELKIFRPCRKFSTETFDDYMSEQTKIYL